MDLFPIALPADTFRSTKLRLEPVRSDSMEPTLRMDRDFVMLKPTDRYEGEGIYLVDVGGNGEHIALYRCEHLIGHAGDIRMTFDNPLYQGRDILRKQDFETCVLGIVVADVKVRVEHVLRDMVEGRP